MLGLEYFSFSDLFSPIFLAFMLLVTAAYFVVIGPLSEKFADSEPVPFGKKLSFVCGMVILYLAQGGPINLLGHTMFTFHMATMALSYLVAPPLLMMGLPTWLWRAILAVNPFKKFSFFARPVVAAVIFNGLFSFYHFPAVHDYVMLHFTVHRLYYVLLFVTAVLMWWTLINPLPGKNKTSGLAKTGYIFLNMVLLTPACGLIIFAIKPLYATYSDPNVWAQAMGYCVTGDPSKLLKAFGGPTFFNIMSTKVDQQVGGIVMKFIQEIIFASMLARVFYRWYKDENKEENDAVPAELGEGSLNQV
ncbi:cytochrome c oxidase assembly factor CtaG [Paenibacillus donghaensis]|uniref:cytochrome c oxidase assembly factor CtaG n=1 Tax=Paenibacillus donghaensis TaxID=414771 RepID=UPI0018831800|nr:cytochrome c oxidase assembly factor CtaG [Paenibacillus donghaensis]MBE9917347.1 cytochrome c oxidase assembly factor CtaG [Paenibacillus donghaensis]